MINYTSLSALDSLLEVLNSLKVKEEVKESYPQDLYFVKVIFWQAVRKQFSGRFGHDSAFHDEAELQCLQNLLVLYSSTTAAKHLQRDIARGVEAFISVSSKQIEILRKLAQDCCKYGDEYQASGYALARASSDFGNSHNLMETERENLLRVLGEQVYEPLRAMVMGAPLEDARHLTYRYKKISQDVESQLDR